MRQNEYYLKQIFYHTCVDAPFDMDAVDPFAPLNPALVWPNIRQARGKPFTGSVYIGDATSPLRHAISRSKQGLLSQSSAKGAYGLPLYSGLDFVHATTGGS